MRLKTGKSNYVRVLKANIGKLLRTKSYFLCCSNCTRITEDLRLSSTQNFQFRAVVNVPTLWRMLKPLRRRRRRTSFEHRRRRRRQEAPHLGRRGAVARRSRGRRRLTGHGGIDGCDGGRLVLGVLQDVEVRPHVVAHHVAAIVVVVVLLGVEAGRSRSSRLLENAEKGKN